MYRTIEEAKENSLNVKGYIKNSHGEEIRVVLIHIDENSMFPNDYVYVYQKGETNRSFQWKASDDGLFGGVLIADYKFIILPKGIHDSAFHEEDSEDEADWEAFELNPRDVFENMFKEHMLKYGEGNESNSDERNANLKELRETIVELSQKGGLTYVIREIFEKELPNNWGDTIYAKDIN